MKLGLLRNLMLLDAVILFLLGAWLVLAPRQMQAMFGFQSLPQAVHYMLGLWGCVFVSLAVGYFLAAVDPVKNVVWVQAGIARGVLEVAFGLYYVGQGLVTFAQGGFGIIVAALFTVAYLALYPRPMVRAT